MRFMTCYRQLADIRMNEDEFYVKHSILYTIVNAQFRFSSGMVACYIATNIGIGQRHVYFLCKYVPLSIGHISWHTGLPLP